MIIKLPNRIILRASCQIYKIEEIYFRLGNLIWQMQHQYAARLFVWLLMSL